jgi:hypothetical protein
MKSSDEIVVISSIERSIYLIRGKRVMLDADLAAVYGVPTKRLNEQVKRNRDRFPSDFAFRLSRAEVMELNRSQIATGSQKHRDSRFPPLAFTEYGAVMAANVLNSARAVRMSVYIVRAFVRMREELFARSGMERRLARIEKTLLGHDAALRDLYEKIRPLLLPPPESPKRQIGFHVKEAQAAYRAMRTGRSNLRDQRKRKGVSYETH